MRQDCDLDKININGAKPRIRLRGVLKKLGEGYRGATSALEWLFKGKKCPIPIDTGKYGRVVARAFLSGGREINFLLIRRGNKSSRIRKTASILI